MSAVYEYILAAFVMLIMIVAVQTNIQTMINNQITLIEHEEHSTAESIIDMILLSPGYPSNWENFTENPISFGLASEMTTEAYTLDAQKVIRLSENSTLYISPGELRSLLGLSSDCNFIIRVTPMLALDIEGGGGNYVVTVKDSNGFLVSNVNVTGYYVNESLSEQLSEQKVTGIDGKCTFNFSPKTDYVFVVCASLLDAKTMMIYPSGFDFRVEGDRVIRGEVPLVNSINYTTGTFYGLVTQRAERYVTIDGFMYLFEFELWR